MIVLPWPPTVNNLTTVVRGRKINSKSAREYKVKCAAIIGRLAPLAGNIRLTLDLYPPDRRRRDASNHIKAVEDVLTECGAWNDDSQVKQLIVNMHAPDGGRCEVRYEEMT